MTNTELNVGGLLADPLGMTIKQGPSDEEPKDYFIEEQSMRIDYVRVPIGVLLSKDISLSKVDTKYNIKETTLQCRISANYSIKKLQGVFEAGDIYQQPQKFTVTAYTTDKHGNSYGDVEPGTLGPVGFITTTNPWISRRPWVDGEDKELSDGFGGNNGRFVSLNSKCGTGPSFSDNFGRFVKTLIPPSDSGKLQDTSDNTLWEGISFGLKFGPYTTTQDSIDDVWQLIDSCANLVKVEGLWVNQPQGNEDCSLSEKDKGGVSLYSSLRHDYN